MKTTCRLLLYVSALTILFARTSGGRAGGCQPRGTDLKESDESGRLFLNKHIEDCNPFNAKQESKVKFFQEQFGIEAHSGYITVDYDKKNFFFFLVKKDDNNRPLILYLNGGPGQTSLFGQFMESGPVAIGKDGNLHRRNFTLYDDYDVLYLDQPVGAGFSFTNNSTAYPKSLEDIAKDIEKFLRLFFRAFKEYKNRDLYIAGLSYGVRAAAAAAVYIHKNFTRENKLPPNVKGVMLGVGLYTDTLTQVDTSNLLLSLGLVDHHGYEELTDNMKKMRELVATKNKTKIMAAFGLYMQTFGSTTNFSNPKFRLRRTGFLYNGNALKPTKPDEFLKFADLMKNTTFRGYIHAGGNVSFREKDSVLMMNLINDLHRDIGKEIQELLEAKLKVLVFLGQLDLKVSNVATEKFLRNLKWSGSEEFKEATHKPWWATKDDKDFAGYFTKVQNLTLVKLLTSGHYPSFDQPQATHVMMQTFINGTEFITKTVSEKGEYQ